MKTKIMTLTKFHFTAEIKINKIYLENNLQKPYFFSLKLRFSRVVFKTSYLHYNGGLYNFLKK